MIDALIELIDAVELEMHFAHENEMGGRQYAAPTREDFAADYQSRPLEFPHS